MCTSDIVCVDAEFQNIVLPDGSGLNDALSALERYFIDNPPSDGADGADGDAGTNGADGTDAFKFIKEFNTNLDGETVTISLAEINAGGGLPVGYIQGGGASKKCDFNIECWIRNNDPSPSGVWIKSTPTTIPQIAINESTGLISITTGGGSTKIILRVVIVG
jgi:hypothetical protein